MMKNNKFKNLAKGSVKLPITERFDVQGGVKFHKIEKDTGISSLNQSHKNFEKRKMAVSSVVKDKKDKKNLENEELLSLIQANIIVFDREDKPILFVSVDFRKGRKLEDVNLAELMINYQADIPFIMLVKPEKTGIFKWGKIEPIFLKETIEILSFYEPEFGKKRIFQSYLTTLVEAWLRDLAYHWKSDEPPFIEEIEEIELLEKLNNGSTKEID